MPRRASIDRLIARGRIPKAIERLREGLRERPGSVSLRLQLADLLARNRQLEEAAEAFHGLVDEFASQGHVAKAIAVLKKMRRLDLGPVEVEERLAILVQRRETEARSAGPAATPPVSAGEGRTVAPVQTSPLFLDFSLEQLVAVIRGLALREVSPGEIVVTEGEEGGSLFVVAAGSLRVWVRDEAGGNEEVRRLEPGDFFGEISLLSGSPRTATVVAAEEGELLELDRATLDEIAVQHPRVPEVLREFAEERAGSPEERSARRS